jgi:hypothetical protein
MAQTTTAKLEAKNVSKPDETRSFDHGKLDVVFLQGLEAGCFTLEPGWRWSQDVKPIAKTDYCQKHHVGYQLSGTLHTKLADGTELESKGGDFVVTPPGHDAWVVGDEPVKLLDFQGVHDYAKKQ